MPALQSIVLTDRATPTNINHTLVPTGGPNGSVGRVAVADASGNMLSERSLIVNGRRTGKRLRSTLKLQVPIIANEVINGVTVPRVARVAFANIDFSFSMDSTEQERKDVVGMLQSALDPSKVLVNDTVVKGQAVWGT